MTTGGMVNARRSDPGGGPVAPRAVPAVLCILALTAGDAAPLQGQVKPSESATVSQTVDGTVMTVEYDRPRARGREVLFGGLVHWGDVWTPGANDATVLELSRDVEIEGQPVPAGRWSVWMVAREEGPWELVLDPRDDLWHTAHPEETGEQIRVPVTPETGDHVEALLWHFPDVRRSGATLAMSWGDVRVPLEIEVEPTFRYTLTAAEAAPYLGSWTMERMRGRNEGQVRTLEIAHHPDGSLRARGTGDDDLEWVLQPKAEGIFALGWTRDGELWAGSTTFLEMTYQEGTPTGFAIRGSEDEVTWQGERVSEAQEAPVVTGDKTREWMVAAAALAAPEPLRSGAEVRAWTGDDRLVTLRPGENGIICLADRPDRDGFHAACYAESLEPFMARGRELSREGVPAGERNEIRWREIEEGKIPMPPAGAVYNLRFPDDDFDPATTDPATGGRLHAIYMAGATAESTGLPVQPGAGPWLMLPGTPSAHVMISLPARKGG